MKSVATPDFWDCYSKLPKNLRLATRNAYALWSENPRHPGLHFKAVPSAGEGVHSVRVGIHWRALGVLDGDTMIWFWIGTHADYDKMLKRG